MGTVASSLERFGVLGPMALPSMVTLLGLGSPHPSAGNDP